MKVLKKGKPKKWSVKEICKGCYSDMPGCGANLLIEQGDIFKTEHGSLGDIDIKLSFECPQCKAISNLTNQFSVPSSFHPLLDYEQWKVKVNNAP